uniref:Uncharacterized protein n=1 Tax=Pseudictyota dubia TaxID=2749911 RepID=A0A7R9ZG64_9STRA|mmetsp:Transcript_49615/g.91829  ORF Transcript_49615/g.91829 Transcript_49615/m.91829 type:complete len:142 (+) Transcript_49615:117-542(+)
MSYFGSAFFRLHRHLRPMMRRKKMKPAGIWTSEWMNGQRYCLISCGLNNALRRRGGNRFDTRAHRDKEKQAHETLEKVPGEKLSLRKSSPWRCYLPAGHDQTHFIAVSQANHPHFGLHTLRVCVCGGVIISEMNCLCHGTR